MPDEALDLFQQMRPPSPALSPDIRRGGGNLPAGIPDLHNLAMVPGTPGYNSRIPKPPCYRCGEDHVPNHDYGHPWEGEPVVHDEPVSASAIMRRPATDVYEPPAEPAPSAPSLRVALYVGRGDTYVVAIEQAPDWESTTTFKVQPEQVVPLVAMARALGAKISDKTGGDLLMLEQESNDARSQSAQNHVGSAEGPGDREPRRQGQRANGPQKDKPGQGLAATG